MLTRGFLVIPEILTCFQIQVTDLEKNDTAINTLLNEVLLLYEGDPSDLLALLLPIQDLLISQVFLELQQMRHCSGKDIVHECIACKTQERVISLKRSFFLIRFYDVIDRTDVEAVFL